MIVLLSIKIILYCIAYSLSMKTCKTEYASCWYMTIEQATCIRMYMDILYFLHRFGPLRNQWCVRFESKNGQMKHYVSWNFKNVPLTVATYHQQWMCYNFAVRPGQETSGFLYPGDKISFGMYSNLHIR